MHGYMFPLLHGYAAPCGGTNFDTVYLQASRPVLMYVTQDHIGQESLVPKLRIISCTKCF